MNRESLQQCILLEVAYALESMGQVEQWGEQINHLQIQIQMQLEIQVKVHLQIQIHLRTHDLPLQKLQSQMFLADKQQALVFPQKVNNPTHCSYRNPQLLSHSLGSSAPTLYEYKLFKRLS